MSLFPGVEPEQGAEGPQEPDRVRLSEEAQPDREEPQTQHQEEVSQGGAEAVWAGSAPVTKWLFPPLSEPHKPAQRELKALDREIEKQTVQLREWQMEELLQLWQQLHVLEQEKRWRHQHEVRTTSRWMSARQTPTDVHPSAAGLPEAEGDR